MTTTQSLNVGATLRHGSYRIERILGQGGFGITYLATDLALDRKVAIKEFFPKDFCDREGATSHVTLGTSSTAEFVTRLKAKFIKEARNIAKFDHPGIIKIHAAFEENNTAYYVMDYIEGTTLSEMVRRGGPLAVGKALEYVGKVGEALDYVHGHRMNHLDVKPANIMVRASDNMPVLIDFGLSKQYDSEGQQTTTTPTGISHGYAPMEQYATGGVNTFSPKTDLYSLAATLYFILSGVVPPQAIKLLDEPLTFPDRFPPQLMNPIARAMSASKKQRQESVHDFIRQIDMVGEDESTVMPKAPSVPVSGKVKSEIIPPAVPRVGEISKGGRNKWMWLIAAVAVVSVAGLLWWMHGESGDPEEMPPEAVVDVEPDRPTVENMYWDSPLGVAAYTGEVAPDSVDLSGKMLPHGKGVARITGGEYAGSVYDGHFIQGRMEGQTTYTLKSGDTFVGTYKDNRYEKGRYTIKETGEYFDGTFKNGNPTDGDWYDKNGNKL